MAGKDNPKTEEQGMQSLESARGADTNRVLNTLDQVFSTFRTQLKNEEPKPFDGAAKVAVDVFNDITAGLKFKSVPRAVRAEARAVSPTDVDLTWTDQTNNADSYLIKRCQGYNCQPIEEIARLGSGARIFRDHDLTSGTTYRYQVLALNTRGAGTSNTVDVTTPASRDDK